MSSFEHGKPIVGGNESIDWTQVAQGCANFAKMGGIAFLQLRIMENHKAPLGATFARPVYCLLVLTSVKERGYSASRLP